MTSLHRATINGHNVLISTSYGSDVRDAARLRIVTSEYIMVVPPMSLDDAMSQPELIEWIAQPYHSIAIPAKSIGPTLSIERTYEITSPIAPGQDEGYFTRSGVAIAASEGFIFDESDASIVSVTDVGHGLWKHTVRLASDAFGGEREWTFVSARRTD